MTPEELHIAEIKRTVQAIEKTKSHKLTSDYGKHLARLTKELAEYRKLRARSNARS